MNNITSFNQTIPTPLCEIMGRHNSDKGGEDILNNWHNYTTFYYHIFRSIQTLSLRIFELGLGTNNINIPSNMGSNGRPGASLYGWHEFFPNAKIFGADIDKDILFNTDRIKTFFCDQTNPDIIKNMWEHPDLRDNFDIIIEDGLHKFNANVCFFENSIHKLNPKGYYIIEDIDNKELHLFNTKVEEWKLKYPDISITGLTMPTKRNNYDNNLLVI